MPQVCWFDVEAADIVGDYEKDYENILRGMESMAGGDLVFDQIHIDYSQVDWEEGRGEMTLTFTCNGRPCEILLKVLDDWLDVSMLDKLNAIIEALPGYTGRKIFGCSDMGQEVFLFYQDAFWAQEFEEENRHSAWAIERNRKIWNVYSANRRLRRIQGFAISVGRWFPGALPVGK